MSIIQRFVLRFTACVFCGSLRAGICAFAPSAPGGEQQSAARSALPGTRRSMCVDQDRAEWQVYKFQCTTDRYPLHQRGVAGVRHWTHPVPACCFGD